MEHASCADTRQLQRATIRSIQVLGPLGRGAYAEVHLVAVPVDGQLKLCAQKLLLLAPPPTPAAVAAPQQGNSSSNSSCCAPPPPPCLPEPPSRQQLKLSSAGDFQRERSMHQLCSGCPFIVQVLAAKTAPTAMLLLMQFAEHGSLAQAYQLAVPEGPTQRAAAVGHEPGEYLANRQHPSPLAAAVGTGCSPCGLPAAAVQQQQHTQLLYGVPPAGQVVGAGMSEAVARFYIACVVLALEHMHARSLVHRDVKPQNVLLYSNGYVKLGDLGCCVALPPGQLARTRSGTAAYMAPEVVAAQPYGAPADMWSLGVTLLHLLEGSVPAWCDGATPTGHAEPQQQVLPPRYSPELCCLLRSLLSVDAGARPTAATIQDAPWFTGFAWQQLRDQTLAAPPLAAAATAAAAAAAAAVAVAAVAR